jgi:hypothetical protein
MERRKRVTKKEEKKGKNRGNSIRGNAEKERTRRIQLKRYEN